MHTREQVAALWCPMVRMVRHEPTDLRHERPTFRPVGGCNTLRDERAPASTSCIADQCAMWRWGTKPDPDHIHAVHPPASFRAAPRVRADVGYCGLAGSPAA